MRLLERYFMDIVFLVLLVGGCIAIDLTMRGCGKTGPDLSPAPLAAERTASAAAKPQGPQINFAVDSVVTGSSGDVYGAGGVWVSTRCVINQLGDSLVYFPVGDTLIVYHFIKIASVSIEQPESTWYWWKNYFDPCASCLDTTCHPRPCGYFPPRSRDEYNDSYRSWGPGHIACMLRVNAGGVFTESTMKDNVYFFGFRIEPDPRYPDFYNAYPDNSFITQAIKSKLKNLK